MGEGAWAQPVAWGQPLVCFPGPQRTWTVPHQNWHLDGPPEPGGHIRIGRVFAILAPLAAGGGGTLMAEGSHHLVRQAVERHGGILSSSETRKRLKTEHPWFGELMAAGGDPAQRLDRFMAETTLVGDVPLRLAEMTGEPGDVWLMHPDMLHAGAPNVLPAPRLVLTEFVMPKGRSGA
jgi:ectoine hydroxylase-related dioxygenase (phytanoyl-CoA dioxygenase family)